MLSLRLLREADRYYRSGDIGLWYLSFRSACAVSAARQVYSEIGSLLVTRGARAWDQRTYVTGALKLWVVSELLGTTYGMPFGSYSYTTLLGPKWFDWVPLLIPLSWLTMSWAAWIIRVPQSTWISGGAIRNMPFGRLASVAGSSHEQSH
jgi:uncharacterized membrane protein